MARRLALAMALVAGCSGSDADVKGEEPPVEHLDEVLTTTETTPTTGRPLRLRCRPARPGAIATRARGLLVDRSTADFARRHASILPSGCDTKRERVRLYGNAVTPPAMRILLERCVESLS